MQPPCALIMFSLVLMLSLLIWPTTELDVVLIADTNHIPLYGAHSDLRRETGKDNHKFKADVPYDEVTFVPDIDVFYDEKPIDMRNKDEFEDDERIVGGDDTDISLYPYHVAYGVNCGGAIIGPKWVLTAGHCGKKSHIRVGSKYLNQGKRIAVRKSYIHPEWSSDKKEHPFDFDFQLLELSQTLTFDENVQPVKVARIQDMMIGKIVTVTGWGNTEENGPFSNVLRAVRVPIIAKELCQRVQFPYFRGQLTSRMFCAGYSEGKKDACQGDSGGPAVAGERLMGMVSFGYGCATPGSYGVYSKVAKVRDWIEEVTGMILD